MQGVGRLFPLRVLPMKDSLIEEFVVRWIHRMLNGVCRPNERIPTERKQRTACGLRRAAWRRITTFYDYRVIGSIDAPPHNADFALPYLVMEVPDGSVREFIPTSWNRARETSLSRF